MKVVLLVMYKLRADLAERIARIEINGPEDPAEEMGKTLRSLRANVLQEYTQPEFQQVLLMRFSSMRRVGLELGLSAYQTRLENIEQFF